MRERAGDRSRCHGPLTASARHPRRDGGSPARCARKRPGRASEGPGPTVTGRGGGQSGPWGGPLQKKDPSAGDRRRHPPSQTLVQRVRDPLSFGTQTEPLTRQSYSSNFLQRTLQSRAFTGSTGGGPPPYSHPLRRSTIYLRICDVFGGRAPPVLLRGSSGRQTTH